MNKKNIKKFSVFLYFFLFFQYSFAVDDSDIFVEAVFFTAVKKSNYEKVIEMIERGVTTNIHDSEDMSPLAYALRNDDEKMFDLLLKNDADVNHQILKKTSLLTFYIKSKKSKLLARLLKADADMNFQDSIGMTPMMHAIENINIDAIKLLLSIDFKDNLDVKITDYSGKTIFDYVENSRNNYLKKLIFDKKNTF
jgi:ankyrin repeat protein